MRTVGVALLLVACGAPPPSEAPHAVPESVLAAVATAAPMRLEMRTTLVARDGEAGLLFRVTNESDRAVLVDLRDVERVVRASDAALRMPLSAEQVHELSLASTLTELRPGRSITYATPFAAEACHGTRTVRLGGVLTALDDGRLIQLVADGAEVAVSCEPPGSLPSGSAWVAEHVPLAASDRSAADFAADMPELVRAASVSGGGDVALLAFSYDPRPIERWRYDACVSVGQCPARAMAQPPGSMQRPAVGMDAAGVTAFCQTRGLHAPSAEQSAAIGDASRPLLDAAADGVVTAGFRCVRAEAP